MQAQFQERSQQPARTVYSLATADPAFPFTGSTQLWKLGPSGKDTRRSQSIIKTGVALKDDLNNLQKIEPFTPEGFEDIASIAQSLKIEQTGLRNLTAIFFQPTPFKIGTTFKLGKTDHSLLPRLTMPQRMRG